MNGEPRERDSSSTFKVSTDKESQLNITFERWHKTITNRTQKWAFLEKLVEIQNQGSTKELRTSLRNPLHVKDRETFHHLSTFYRQEDEHRRLLVGMLGRSPHLSICRKEGIVVKGLHMHHPLET